MTRQEINNIIKEKAEAYGFEVDTDRRVYGVRQRNEDFIGIQIFEMSNLDKSDWENKIGWMDIEIKASICQMGGESTPEELMAAAEQIKRGAKLAKELQEMNLSYSEKF